MLEAFGYDFKVISLLLYFAEIDGAFYGFCLRFALTRPQFLSSVAFLVSFSVSDSDSVSFFLGSLLGFLLGLFLGFLFSSDSDSVSFSVAFQFPSWSLSQ